MDASEAEEEQRFLVQREMEATIRKVSLLTKAGYIDPAVREDVVRVMRALTRPAPRTTTERAEWQMTSAAAVLHLCRIIVRLTNTLSLPE